MVTPSDQHCSTSPRKYSSHFGHELIMHVNHMDSCCQIVIQRTDHQPFLALTLICSISSLAIAMSYRSDQVCDPHRVGNYFGNCICFPAPKVSTCDQHHYSISCKYNVLQIFVLCQRRQVLHSHFKPFLPIHISNLFFPFTLQSF